MFFNFIPHCEDDPMLWACVGWYGFLLVSTWAALIYLRLGFRSIRWLLSRDRSDWVVLWTKFLAPFGAGYLYLLSDENEVIRSELAMFVVLADDKGWGFAAFLVPRCEQVRNGQITFHRCRPIKCDFGPNTLSVNGMPPVHWDAVGSHCGNFIFSPRPIASGLLAALRQKDTKAEVAPT